jgi:hypothetical protein
MMTIMSYMVIKVNSVAKTEGPTGLVAARSAWRPHSEPSNRAAGSTAVRRRHGLANSGRWRWPRSTPGRAWQVIEDALDGVGTGDEADDAHGRVAAGTDQGIDLVKRCRVAAPMTDRVKEIGRTAD